MELLIDGRRCDLGDELPVVPKFDVAALGDVEACRTGRSMRVTLPATPCNDAIACFARDPHAAQRFNSTLHTAQLTAGGATLFAGSVRLLSASETAYCFEVRDGGAAWARQAALTMLRDLPLDYRSELSPTAIAASWSGDTPVRFFPIVRDAYPEEHNSDDLLPVERMLSVDDYLPFLHLATLIEQIVGQAGYRIESRFLQSDFFRSLYLSGAYAPADTAALAARMGFSARRLAPVTAEASATGRVYADPTAIYNTVGNLVETADARATDADGEPLTGLCNNGNCFRTVDGKIAFVPTASVRAGFDYYLRYTTDHRIESRTRLKGFDSLYLGPGTELHFALPNRYADRRDRLTSNYTYRIVVFDHAAGTRYRLTYRSASGTETEWSQFAARSAQVTTPAAGSCSAPALYAANGSGWVRYTGDWALYDGYVGETGQTTVELRVSTPAEAITPSDPKFFRHIYFFGAEPGMRLTLHKTCSLRPVFRTGPGYGSVITLRDVAQLRIRQSELLQAAAHLFNLRFYTDEATRTLRIEPADDLIGEAPEVDWSDRTDFGQPIVRREIAPAIHERRTWCYREGDGPVRRFEAQTGEAFGSWSCTAGSKAALVGEQTLRNPLFAPTLSAAGANGSAPSALLLQTGDRDDLTQSDSTMTPRIVCYAGLHPLPDGERWDYPSGGGSYPLAAFHFAGDAAAGGFTLCFEDRDGLTGLNRFYRRQAAREGALERISLTLRLAPDEYELLFAPASGCADIRSVFRLDTGHGTVRCVLASLDAYDPEAQALRATFERLPED